MCVLAKSGYLYSSSRVSNNAEPSGHLDSENRQKLLKGFLVGIGEIVNNSYKFWKKKTTTGIQHVWLYPELMFSVFCLVRLICVVTFILNLFTIFKIILYFFFSFVLIRSFFLLYYFLLHSCLFFILAFLCSYLFLFLRFKQDKESFGYTDIPFLIWTSSISLFVLFL